ncbi:MAG: hypothetical protein Q7O66_23100 [Dehalococcoidia bacterium]|nr:hypothetical protein [Dehalococcoidia bacterium]
MRLYNFLCNACNSPFQRYAWDELEDTDRECPRCESRDVTQRWIVDDPFESISNFSCGCGAGGG